MACIVLTYKMNKYEKLNFLLNPCWTKPGFSQYHHIGIVVYVTSPIQKTTYLYSAPQPFTKLIRMVHILVSWYTASKPWLTDCDSNAANSWLLNIFKLQPMNKTHTKTNNTLWNLFSWNHNEPRKKSLHKVQCTLLFSISTYT